MNRTITPELRLQFLEALWNTEGDLMTLAQKHRLDLIDLAGMGLDPDTRQYVDGLLRMADMQTQLMLSRYRVNAASTLFSLISPDKGEDDADLKRKACVDLLRVELKRTATDEGNSRAAPMESSPLALEKMREMLYGDEARDAETGGESGQ